MVSPVRYLADTRLAAAALQLFGNTLQSIDSATEFRANLTRLRAQLLIFDAAIRRLRGYQLANRMLDRQRGGLAREGPPLARNMSDFLDAVRDGDRSRVAVLAPLVTGGLQDFIRSARAR